MYSTYKAKELSTQYKFGGESPTMAEPAVHDGGGGGGGGGNGGGSGGGGGGGGNGGGGN